MCRTSRPLIERILAQSVCDGLFGCWVFTGRGRDGRNRRYGKIGRGGRDKGTVSVHRAFYEYYVGPISGHIDHLCRNTLCFNPLHLEDVTNAENQRRRREAALSESDLNDLAAMLDSES